MKSQQAELEGQPPEPDPFRELHLLPTAPQELVVEVYWHMVQRLQQGTLDTPELRSELNRVNEAYSRILRPHSDSVADGIDEQRDESRGAASTKKSWLPFRSTRHSQRQLNPWGLLHLDPGAPSDIVDLAYLFWRLRLRSQWQGPASAKLDELQGAYEALREEPNPAVQDGAAVDGTPALEEPTPVEVTDVEEESDVNAAEDAGDEVAGSADEETPSEIEAASPQGRGMPLIGPLGRWAKRRFGARESAEPSLEVADEPIEAATPPDISVQEEPWPPAWSPEEYDEPQAMPEAETAAAFAALGFEAENATREAETAAPAEASAPKAEIPAEYRIDGDIDREKPTVAPSAAPTEALAYLIAEAGSVTDARAVIGSQPFAIGSDRSCGLMVGGLGTNGGAIAARIWAHDDRFMLHVLAKEPAVLVNGQPMVWAMLEDGDQLQFGDGIFRFERATTLEGR